jgi:PadR family transcriptional regulator, regulatory protein PadR
MMKIDKEVLKGYVDTIILSLLYQVDMYGYELSKKVKEESNGLFELKEGTLYLAFKRLETNGYATSYWDDSHGGGRRKYYTISQTGTQYLREKKREWSFLKEIMNHFLEGVEEDESNQP